MMGIGFPELMIILVIIMIIFGAGKLPEIGSAFGRSIKNFKTSMKEAEAEEGSEGQTAKLEGEGAPSGELPASEPSPHAEAGSSVSSAESAPVTAKTSATQVQASAPAPKAASPAQPAQAQTAQAPQGKPKPKERVKSEEEKMIEDAIKELKDKRIGTIRTPHDGLVQQNDVFTRSVNRSPWGRSRGKGIRRDVL